MTFTPHDGRLACLHLESKSIKPAVAEFECNTAPQGRGRMVAIVVTMQYQPFYTARDCSLRIDTRNYFLFFWAASRR